MNIHKVFLTIAGMRLLYMNPFRKLCIRKEQYSLEISSSFSLRESSAIHGERKDSRSTGSMVVICATFAALSVSLPVMSLSEDQCTNDAIPRSTPSSNFVVLADGDVVRDEKRNLEWQRCSYGQDWTGSSCHGDAILKTWQDALYAVHALNTSWRIPNVKELASIVEECKNNPSINEVVFPNTPMVFFWTSTPGRSVGFSNGTVDGVHQLHERPFRLVRDAQ